MQKFTKEDGDNRKEDPAYMDPDTDEEDMEDVIHDDKIERHRRMVFKDKNRGVDGEKSILHGKRWDVYMN